MESAEAQHLGTVHLNHRVSGGKLHSEQLAFKSYFFFLLVSYSEEVLYGVL